ncbi:MAG: hypothetical protein V4582_13220 [Pseudomonadota bacterium]
MSGLALRALVLNDVRLRLRRLSTLVVLLAVIGVIWAVIPAPASGNALMANGNARVLNTSSALALGSGTWASFLFSLAAFYLVRGRMAEDIRSGIGGVIGATQTSNTVFLVSRWLGGVAYMLALLFVFMGAVLVLHLLRAEGPIQLWVYLQAYALTLLPMVFFTVSCAVLFDSVPALMGKGGDVLYFFLWFAQLLTLAPLGTAGATPPWHLLFDFTGMASAMYNLMGVLHTHNVSVGWSSFDPKLPPVALPSALWSVQMTLMRCASAALALLPMLPAALLFHRYSPDRVKVGAARARRSPLTLVNSILRPAAVLAQPLLRMGARIGGVPGQVLADLGLTLAAAPAGSAALLVVGAASLLAKQAALGGVLLAGVACWGILVSDISTRDFQADTAHLSAAAPGGARARYLRHFGVTFLLGLLFCGGVALRWAPHDGLRAGALLAGLFGLSAAATMLGRCSGTARTFCALFLFGLYIAVNDTHIAFIDMVAFNGAATARSALAWCAVGLVCSLLGYGWNRRQAA